MGQFLLLAMITSGGLLFWQPHSSPASLNTSTPGAHPPHSHSPSTSLQHPPTLTRPPARPPPPPGATPPPAPGTPAAPQSK